MIPMLRNVWVTCHDILLVNPEEDFYSTQLNIKYNYRNRGSSTNKRMFDTKNYVRVHIVLNYFSK